MKVSLREHSGVMVWKSCLFGLARGWVGKLLNEQDIYIYIHRISLGT